MLKVLSALWIGALLIWVGLLAAEWYLSGPTACALDPASSLYGTSQWSWLPPGRTCTWQLALADRTYTHTDDPPTARLGVLLLFALWGASLVLFRRRRKESV